MILIDNNGIAHYSDAIGLDENKAWGIDWVTTHFNSNNAELINLPVPKHFMGGRFTLENDALIPDAEWALVIADLEDNSERENAKIEREKAVAKIVVTVSTGKVFDGDEKAQNRMCRALMVLNIAGQAGGKWTLANNENVYVTKEELSEALCLAGFKQSELWPIET